MPAKPLRVLQITDLHIVADPDERVFGIDTARALESVFTAARADGWPPDAVIVTGDVVEDGAPGSYERARSMLESLDAPVYCLCGNHDDPGAMHAHLHGATVRVERQAVLGSWQVVFLHSPISGENHGRLNDGELDALLAAVDDGAAPHTLVALHHGPLRPCPTRGCNLDNADALLDLVGRSKALRAVTSGHVHFAIEGRHKHVRLFATPATCVLCEHAADVHLIDSTRHGYRWFTLFDDGRLDTAVRWAEPTAEPLDDPVYVPKR